MSLLRRGAASLAVATLAATGTVLPASEPEPSRVTSAAVPLAGKAGMTPGRTRSVSVTSPAEMVAFDWNGLEEGAVEVRALTGGKWSDWARLDGNPEEGPDPGSIEHRERTSITPSWVGRGTSKVEVRAVEGSLPNLRMHLIRSPREARTSGIAQAGASPAYPGIIPRSSWGADESWRKCGPDYAGSLRNSFVHHTVNVNTYGPDEADDIIRAIYHFHTHHNGWCDIGYNFLVDRYGRRYEGRFGGVDKAVIGAHAGGFNTGSTGVALIGDHRSVPVPHASMDAVRDILAWKFSRHTVDPHAVIQVTSRGSSRYPSGTMVSLSTIAGHRDVSATECPGQLGYDGLEWLRGAVHNVILSTPPYPLEGWAPASEQPRLLALNGYGGLQPAGSQPSVLHRAYWPGWAIARSAIAVGTTGGYVLDGWGGIHSYGDASSPSGGPYWWGWDIARAIARGPTATSGYVLDGWGGLHSFGGAPRLVATGYWPGWDIARSVATKSDGTGGYVLDGFGGLHSFGAAMPATGATSYWPGWDIARGLALRPDGQSGYVLDGWGGLHPFGGAPGLPVSKYTPNWDGFRGIVLNSSGTGGWTVDVNGFIFPFGSAGQVKLSGTWIGPSIGRGLVLAG